MQILIVSEDKTLLHLLEDSTISEFGETTVFNSSNDPLEVISAVHSSSPTLLILDDDMLKPNSSKILKSIKQMTKNEFVIFFTSDNSLELGREISPIGVYYYGIKPIPKEAVLNLIKSVNSRNKSIIHS